ncbi:globin family protein [Rhizosphaericola mali]|uniref:Group 1 truncated hemoglobin n=1 Tax=Rhizosphaericola mali TaxID=2545455 RepID=A0A5P2FXQ6_9BACT|nr:group 1 truncated hemoglobin [Rhizosphaericola mali]QES88314.1 group 1 truncated hemoglobin [Rhizosphaericola mali]
MKSKLFIICASLLSFSYVISSCKKSDDTMQAATLYDTLGWFVQGASSSMSITGQGTKLINDPANSGTTIQAGRLAIRTVVDSAIFVIAGDPQMDPYFATLLTEVGAGNLTGFTALSKTFTDFLEQAISGQQIYKGLSMTAAHNHSTNVRFGSTTTPTADSSDFNQFVSDIATAATTQVGVPSGVVKELGALLYTTEGAVVQSK